MKKTLALSVLLLAPQINCLGQITIKLDRDSCSQVFQWLNIDGLEYQKYVPLFTLLPTDKELSPVGVYNRVELLVKRHVSIKSNYTQETVDATHQMIPEIVKTLLKKHLSTEKDYQQALQELYDAGLLQKPDQNNCEKELKEVKKMFEQLMATKTSAKG